MTADREEPKPKRINIALDPDLHTELKVRSVREGEDLKDLVPRLLREALGLPPAGDTPEQGRKQGLCLGTL